MRHPASFIAGIAAGALAMYYLDPAMGTRRRALVRDKLVSAGHGLADLADTARVQCKRATDRMQGIFMTGHLDGRTRRPPEDDEHLRERIRSRLGRIVRHSRQLCVDVHDGDVVLTGRALRDEANMLVRELHHMPGVQSVRTQLKLHDREQELMREISRPGSARRAQGAAEPQPQGAPS
jgi:hypothetical protein